MLRISSGNILIKYFDGFTNDCTNATNGVSVITVHITLCVFCKCQIYGVTFWYNIGISRELFFTVLI